MNRAQYNTLKYSILTLLCILLFCGIIKHDTFYLVLVLIIMKLTKIEITINTGY